MKLATRDKRKLQSTVMACWWANPTFGRRETDWAGMAGELYALLDGANARGDEAEIDQLRAMIGTVNNQIAFA